MSDPRILDEENLRAAEKKYGITLKEAAEILHDLKGSQSTAPFDEVEREAILFVGAAMKMEFITKEYGEELFGVTRPH